MSAVLRTFRLAVIQFRCRDTITAQDAATFSLPVRPLRKRGESLSQNRTPTTSAAFIPSNHNNYNYTSYPGNVEALHNQPMNPVPFQGSDPHQNQQQGQQHQDEFLNVQEQQRMQVAVDDFIVSIAPANGSALFPILDELLMSPPQKN